MVIYKNTLTLISDHITVAISTSNIITNSTRPNVTVVVLNFLTYIYLITNKTIGQFRPLRTSNDSPTPGGSHLRILVISNHIILTLVLIYYVNVRYVCNVRHRGSTKLNISRGNLPVIAASCLRTNTSRHILTIDTRAHGVIGCTIVHASHNSLVSDSPIRQTHLLSNGRSTISRRLTRTYTSLLSGPSRRTVTTVDTLKFNNVCIIPRANSSSGSVLCRRLDTGVTTSGNARSLIFASDNDCCHLALHDDTSRRISAS